MRKGWAVSKLSDLIRIQNGYAFDSKFFNPQVGLPLVRIRSLKEGKEQETFYSGSYDDKYIVADGDLLIGMDGEFGCYEWKGGMALLNQRVCRLQSFSSSLLPRFLFYGVNTYLKEIEAETGYTTVKHLSSKQIGEIKFPHPSLADQERIVAILDEAFANIAIAKANTERALKNVEEVAFSELFQIFEKQYSKYPNVELKELAQSISDGDHSPPPKAPQGVPFITIGNINKEELRIDFNDTFKVPRTYFDGLQTSRRPQSGDVLYTVTGSYGIPVLVEKEVEFCFQRHIGLVRPKATTSSRWLFFLFQTPQLKRQADEGATGTAQKTVSLGLLRSFRVPSTPLPDQISCASDCEKIQKWTDDAKCAYLKKLSALDELKRSLLNQAFSGQL
jgi:type I restriction enzyme S subunit